MLGDFAMAHSNALSLDEFSQVVKQRVVVAQGIKEILRHFVKIRSPQAIVKMITTAWMGLVSARWLIL